MTTAELRPSRRRRSLTRTCVRLGTLGALGLGVFLPARAAAQLRREAPTSLTDAEFWEFFTTRSEAGGTFLSENFVSNETSFQDVIPTLQGSLTPGGVYLGVGPEQNFTYIANLKPRLAVIFDIRRQNAMEHLMYKALFELAPTRADFVAKLFSRPLPGHFEANAKVADLFEAADSISPSDSAYRSNYDAIIKLLTEKHHFGLSPTDIASIAHVYNVFFEAGPGVNYGFHTGAGAVVRSMYPTYGELQSAMNADSIQMAFLATEANYQSVRDMERRNLVIPVVGDFAGPKAIRSVGEYLRQRDMTVTAFYLSNVEQYLFQQDVADRFYQNVGTLPIDGTSTFIRSVPRAGMGRMIPGAMRPGGTFNFGGGQLTIGGGSGGSTFFSMSIVDSAGVRVLRTVQDSAGTQVTHVSVDSTGRIVSGSIVDSTLTMLPLRLDSLSKNMQPGGFIIQRDSTVRPRTMTLDSLMRSMIGTLRDSSVVPLGAPGAFIRQTPAISLGGSLTSGLASMRECLDAVTAGRVMSYQDIIAMTKISGWK